MSSILRVSAGHKVIYDRDGIVIHKWVFHPGVHRRRLATEHGLFRRSQYVVRLSRDRKSRNLAGEINGPAEWIVSMTLLNGGSQPYQFKQIILPSLCKG